MRIEASITAISWIPSEAIEGLPKLPFSLGIGHYDPPPPDMLAPGELDRLRDADRFREANELRAWIEVTDGRITGHGNEGRGLVGSTTFRFGVKDVVVPGVAFETLSPDPEVGDSGVRFVQTVGGRAGFPAPRRVRGGPYFRIHSATAWTTLELLIRSDGTSQGRLTGASPFPRHWIYDGDGKLCQKAGTIDFDTWYREAHGRNTPWGEEDSPAFVTEAETALERQLSADLMGRKASPRRRNVGEGETLVEQGAPGDELYLLLDGVLAVEIDGDTVAEIGPGAILGERAVLEQGRRTATLRALTKCRVAVVPAAEIDRSALEQLAAARRAEAQASP
jgi:hypothetical protein